MTFKPMLAATVDSLDQLRFPLLASPKLDGIRALVRDGQLVSRSLKPIPNRFTQDLFGDPRFEGLDGELIVGSPTAPDVFRQTSSGVMSFDGCPDVKFFVFDNFNDKSDFHWRFGTLSKIVWRGPIVTLKHVLVNDVEEVAALEGVWLKQGYEGMMLRDIHGAYKHGRPTMKEQGLMKLKKFEDAEAVITGVIEQRHNGNEVLINALGQKERGTKKAGMLGKSTLGAIEVVGIGGQYDQVKFNIGTGFDDATRRELWADKTSLPGMMIKYKFFPSGSKDAPRFPVFIGFRDPIDL